MSIDPIVQSKRQDILRIAASYGGKRVRLFGSAARGARDGHSDFDLLVTLEQGRSLLDVVGMKQDVEDLLGCEVDVVTEASISPYLRDEILREAVDL